MICTKAEVIAIMGIYNNAIQYRNKEPSQDDEDKRPVDVSTRGKRP